MASLYEINKNYMQILSILDDEDLTADEIEELLKQLNQNEETFEEKSANYLKFIKHEQGQLLLIENEIKRLEKLKSAKNNKINNFKSFLLYSMQQHSFKKINTNLYSAWIKETESLEILDIEKIPNDFKTVKVEETINVNKTNLKNAIKEGALVEGAKINKNYSLVIK